MRGWIGMRGLRGLVEMRDERVRGLMGMRVGRDEMVDRDERVDRDDDRELRGWIGW
jgi:hypothetical protein